MIFLPDGKNLLYVMETRVAWTSGRRFGVEIRKMNLRYETDTDRGIIFSRVRNSAAKSPKAIQPLYFDSRPPSSQAFQKYSARC